MRGRYASISEMAAEERIERGYLGSLLRLTLLAPEVVEAILDGQQSPSLALPPLLEPFPINWAVQLSALTSGAALPLRRRLTALSGKRR
ncbi:hypothetical protein GCM10011504_47410 [Siccirubricoccus deserti]|nr:hypothetical protein GCM10011504_47410 [Siccirubricoccus deserti]